MQVEIPDELTEALVREAELSGSNPEEAAIAAIRRGLDAVNRLDEELAPIRDAFRASGLTENEAVDRFDAEKHAARTERRRNAS